MINQIANKIINRIIFVIFFIINLNLFAQNQNITINRTVKEDKSIELNYEKILPGSYYIVMEFNQVNNCYTNEYAGLVNGHSGRLLSLKPINPEQGISYSMKYSSIMGVPNPKVDSLFQYALPFKIGKKIKIYEASNIGEKYFGAEKPANWKSYVVQLKSQDTIFSMRKGIVVKLTDEYEDDASITKQYTSKRNSLVIEHGDGTFAEYKGFKKNSFKVQLGQTVYPQTQLGIVEIFNKSENNYRLDFYIYYLFDLKGFGNDDKQTLRSNRNRYKFLTPSFFTSEGLKTIASSNEYTAACNEAILLQEMTRSEKKKYVKDPTPFK